MSDTRLANDSAPGSTESEGESAASLARIDQACELEFEGITYDVKDKETGKRLRILHNLSGRCRSGKLTALMGTDAALLCYADDVSTVSHGLVCVCLGTVFRYSEVQECRSIFFWSGTRLILRSALPLPDRPSLLGRYAVVLC